MSWDFILIFFFTFLANCLEILWVLIRKFISNYLQINIFGTFISIICYVYDNFFGNQLGKSVNNEHDIIFILFPILLYFFQEFLWEFLEEFPLKAMEAFFSNCFGYFLRILDSQEVLCNLSDSVLAISFGYCYWYVFFSNFLRNTFENCIVNWKLSLHIA